MPAWDLLPPMSAHYRPSLLRGSALPASGLITSRGCTGKCTFCDRSVFGSALRAHSADYVMAMMRELHVTYGMQELFIFDDNFLVFRKRLVAICEALVRERWRFQWSCFARVDFVNPDILKLMRQAGCRLISYGIESGSQEMLDFLQKGISLEKVSQALRWTKEAGIMTEGLFMMGLPRETRETIQMTIDYAKRDEIDDIAITIFTPLPGTRLTQDIQQYGTFDNDWRKMSQHQAVFVPWGFTQEEIEQFAHQGVREFYLRPRAVARYLLRLRSPAHLSAFVQAAFGLLARIGSRKAHALSRRWQTTVQHAKSLLLTGHRPRMQGGAAGH